MAKKTRNTIPNKRPNPHQIAVKYFFNCASNLSNELQDALTKGQSYLWCVNGRPNSTETNRGIRKLSGRSRRFGSNPTSIENDYGVNFDLSKYECLLATVINDQKITFWGSSEWILANPTPGIVIIDNQVVLLSDKFPIRPEFPLDFDVNNNELGGEIFITNNDLPPFYFNIKDLLDNINTQKYFSEFDIEDYTIRINFPINNLIFKDLVLAGSGNGLATGSYSYSYRFASLEGDRTNWSFPTPLIQVTEKIFRLISDSPNEITSFGQMPTDTNITEVGILLRLRIDNFQGYNFLELKVTEYNNGEGLSFVPTSKIIRRIPLNQDDFYILEITDALNTRTENIPVSADDETTVSAIIKKAEAIRYYKNKVELGNIEYEPRIIENSEIEWREINGEKATPFLQQPKNPWKKHGHINPEFRTYCKSFMDYERYGFGVLFWDENYSRILVKPIEDYRDYRFPHKRAVMNNESLNLSYDYRLPLVPQFSKLRIGTDNNTYTTLFDEVEFNGSQTRIGVDEGAQGKVLINISRASSIVGNTITPEAAGYLPHRPKRKGDLSSTYPIDIIRKISVDDTDSNTDNPNPEVDFYTNAADKNPNIRSLGIGFYGLNKYPEWAKGFSIVRTEPAYNVVAQGFGGYHMIESLIPGGNGRRFMGYNKAKNKLSCYFTDIENFITPEQFVTDFLNNPTNYQIQLTRPHHFSTEPYNSRKIFLENRSRQDQQDLLCSIYDEPISPIQGKTYPNALFGKTFNANVPPSFGLTLGEKLWDIASVSLNTDNEEGVTYYEITLTEEIYEVDDINNDDCDFDSRKTMFEPIYVINIIRNANVPQINTQKYFFTGHYQKIKSRVGIVPSGLTNTELATRRFEIVDERPEDFHIFEYEPTTNYKYIYIKKPNSENYLRFINMNNISNYSVPQINDLILDIINGSTLFNGTEINGVYNSEEISGIFNIYFQINNTLLSTAGIAAGDEIEVRYDNTYPVKVFGDCYVGPNYFLNIHRSIGGATQTVDANNPNNQFALCAPFPYYYFAFNESIYKAYLSYISSLPAANADGIPTIYSSMNLVRQLVWRFFCKTRSSTPIMSGSTYPHINYIERPQTFDEALDLTGNYIYEEYESDYPEEKKRWRLGGFKLPGVRMNPDYSKNLLNDVVFSQEFKAGEEQTRFHTRVIWSATRPIQKYGAPGLRTFRPFNYIDLSDKYGQITKLFDAMSNYGDNLYALMERDIALLLVGKKTISGQGNELLTTVLDESNFIGQVIYINQSNTNVLPLEYKFSFAEDKAKAFFANPDGVFMLLGNQMMEIDTNIKNKTRLPLSNIDLLNRQQTYGFFAKRYEEYWLNIKLRESQYITWKDLVKFDTQSNYYELNLQDYFPITYFIWKDSPSPLPSLWIRTQGYENVEFIYIQNESPEQLIVIAFGGPLAIPAYKTYQFTVSNDEIIFIQEILSVPNTTNKKLFIFSSREKEIGGIGEFTYDYDRFISDRNKVYGIREFQGYELDNNTIASSEVSEMYIEAIFSQDDTNFFDKEFIDIQINSNQVPTKLQILERNESSPEFPTEIAVMLSFVKRGGWWTRINRNIFTGQRIVSSQLLFRVYFNESLEENVRVIVNGSILHFKTIV